MKLATFENPIWYESIRLLKKMKKPFWKRVLELANKTRRKRIRVNIYKINKYAKEGKIIIIPGKLLGGERLKHKIKIIAIDASKKVREHIKTTGGEFIYLKDFLKNINEIKYSDLMIIR
ncbi:MAG: 50S ribosomal protein L18e [bacterium]